MARQKKTYLPGFYHVAFSSKFRKHLLVEPIKGRIAFWFEAVAAEKGIQLIEYCIMPQHVHMVIRLRQGENLSYWMQLLKGRTAREIFKEFDSLPFDAGVNNLWTKSFWSEPVPPGKLDVVLNYVRRQEEIHTKRLGLWPDDPSP
jgi:REP element-mobilizing transposase RayT